MTTFANPFRLPNGVMVAHQILVLFVWVRVLFGQQISKKRRNASLFSFLTSNISFIFPSPSSVHALKK